MVRAEEREEKCVFRVGGALFEGDGRGGLVGEWVEDCAHGVPEEPRVARLAGRRPRRRCRGWECGLVEGDRWVTYVVMLGCGE